MKKSFVTMMAAGAFALTGMVGSATTEASTVEEVAYWAFNNQGLPGGGFGYQPSDFPLGADFGTQAGAATITVAGGQTGETIVNGNGVTVLRWVQSFAGSTVNAQFGELAGGSLAVQGGTDTGNNGATIEVAFDATLWEDLAFSFAGRRTGTGFNNVNIALFDGATSLGNVVSGLDITTSTTLALYEYDISALDGITDARIVFTLNGATGPTGNVRLDNFLIEGTLIPEPASLALLGLGSLMLVGRRR